MRTTATVSSKGQLTIPKRFRDRLGIRAGAVVEFREEGGTLVLGKKQGEDPVGAVFGILAGLAEDTDSVVAGLRGARARR